jgi:ribosomal protein S18 acetylase RimI-like enzyme
MTMTRTPLQIRPFEPGDLDAAAELLADRHRRHRSAEPALDPAYEAPPATRREIEALLAGDRADGWAALRDGALVGYLIGVSKSEATWGPNVWVEAPGHAASDPAAIRALYAAAAERWLGEGRANHHALVPASDAELVDAWFSLDFGQQHLHAVMDAPPPGFGVVPRAELTIRRATPSDIPALVPLEQVLPRHLALSPVFSRLPPTSDEDVSAELEEDLGNPAYHYLVAEHDGRVIGLALGASLEISTGATGLNRPAHAGYLAYAAVLPDARGLGAGRALGEAVLVWSRDQGFRSIATDWRSTNLEADRAWRGMGFRPTFRRLHRAIT